MDSSEFEKKLAGLEEKIEVLHLNLTVVLEYISNQPGFSTEEFKNLIKDVDMRDGKMDWKLSL